MESLVRISMNEVVLSIQVYKRVGAVFVTVIQQQHETIAGRFSEVLSSSRKCPAVQVKP